ncbi:MBL fold metallo-hydrolase [Roseobacter cerasinus]|uniref:MBL fold metallo-hydrolase n=1 Tax=Roseobacter cerasinus TaxID=2602289 RepID=UPI001357C6D6|nr:MBL fold metallo-hydrolase [Roseobacter cerasinus]
MSSSEPFDPVIGDAEQLEPGLRRIVAPNPSAMTYSGTNTYLLGDTDIAVIDPGPLDADHLGAILAAITPGQRITHIVVTHAHLDHAALARPLQAECGAPVLAFGPAISGRSAVMQRLAEDGLSGGGEGVADDFNPDETLEDGALLSGNGWRLRVLHTPGHIGNHICLAWGDACFTADHVMGWASSLVSPPDGDLTDFMMSCRRLQKQAWRRFYPGHGDMIEDPAGRLDWLISHRQLREAAILEALRSGPLDAHELAVLIYHDTPSGLIAAATRNVFAHLVDLVGKKRIAPQAPLRPTTRFHLL